MNRSKLLKVRYGLIIGLALLIYGLFQVGQNASQAQQQAAALLASDNSGSTPDLASLRSFVSRHMGASITVFLAASYQRALASAKSNPTTDGQVYHDAQAACYSKTSAVNQANCVQAYIAAHAPAPQAPAVPQVDKSKFSYSLVAPSWTPDLAGMSLLLGGLIMAASLLGFGLKRISHKRYN